MSLSNEIFEILTIKAKALIEQSEKTLNEILDPQFVYIDSLGNRSSKRQYITLYCKSKKMKFIKQRFGNIEIQDFDSFVVTTMNVVDQYEFLGEAFTGTFKAMCIFRKVNGKWLWCAGQTMPVRRPGRN
jgi:hypothetical protein